MDFKYPCQVKASPNYYYSTVKKKKSWTLFFFYFFDKLQTCIAKRDTPSIHSSRYQQNQILAVFFFLFFFAGHKPSHRRRRLDFGSGFRGTSGGDAEIIFQGPIFFLLNRLRGWALPFRTRNTSTACRYLDYSNLSWHCCWYSTWFLNVIHIKSTFLIFFFYFRFSNVHLLMSFSCS